MKHYQYKFDLLEQEFRNLDLDEIFIRNLSSVRTYLNLDLHGI